MSSNAALMLFRKPVEASPDDAQADHLSAADRILGGPGSECGGSQDQIMY